MNDYNEHKIYYYRLRTLHDELVKKMMSLEMDVIQILKLSKPFRKELKQLESSIDPCEILLLRTSEMYKEYEKNLNGSQSL
jgi:hypothetical protein